MAQITLRVPDEMAEDVRREAAREGKSINAWLTALVRVAVDPDWAGSEGERLRERLRRAGLLDESGTPRPGPDPEAVAEARREAAHGTPLSQIVSESRGAR